MSEYRRTFMDRHGAGGADVFRAACYGLLAAIPAFMGMAAFGPGTGLVRLLVAALSGLGAWGIVGYGTHQLAGVAGQTMLRFVGPSGDSTPYQPAFSEQEALAIRGRVDEALASYEELVAASPGDAEVRIAAAELYARSGRDGRRAEALYREARRAAGLAPARDRWITNRLIDLYRGPLADEGRALVELRRLVERYPASREAAHAREAIVRLKRERGS